jgi:hypothetical protein
MKTIRIAILGVGALLAAGSTRMFATEPVQPALTGKVVLLENERTLEGDVERVGDQYRVRRSVGETWVPASRVLRLCQTLEEAYDYLRTRANLQDPDERLRLASWCRQHGLRDQALNEVRAAVELRPRHAESRRLLTHLQQAALDKPAPAPPPQAASEPALPPPTVELTADSLGLFVTRVQPILMNTCASCHASGRGGAFKLTRVYAEAASNRKTMQQNLAAVLAQVNVSQPQASPLLVKAVSAHTGEMTQAPLRNRQAPPYRALEEWVRLTVANNPQLRDPLRIRKDEGGRMKEESDSFILGATQAAPPPPLGESRWGEDARTPPAKPQGPQPVTGPQTPERPPVGEPPASTDPFDPEIFNRQMHPEREKKTPPKPAG